MNHGPNHLEPKKDHMIRLVIQTASEHPKLTAWGGAILGWLSFDWLRAAQFFAAGMAGLASTCAVILSAPKVVAELRSWVDKFQAWRRRRR